MVRFEAGRPYLSSLTRHLAIVANPPSLMAAVEAVAVVEAEAQVEAETSGMSGVLVHLRSPYSHALIAVPLAAVRLTSLAVIGRARCAAT